MKYKLNQSDEGSEGEKGVFDTALKRLLPLMRVEQRSVAIALCAIFVTSALSPNPTKPSNGLAGGAIRCCSVT